MKNIWKRSVSLLLALVMILGNVPMGVFAEEEEGFVCDHAEAVIAETQDANCASDGKNIWVCATCEAQWEETIPATGEHNYVMEETEEVCTGCGDRIELEPAVVEEPAPVAEEPAPVAVEEEIVFMENVQDVVAASIVEIDAEDADGLVWLQLDNAMDIYNYVTGEGGLAKLVLASLDPEEFPEITEKTKVFYTNKQGMSCDASAQNIALLAGTEIYEALDEHKTLSFELKNGNKKFADVAIVFRNISSAEIRIGNVEISSKGEPEDFAALLESKLNAAAEAVEIWHAGDNLTELSHGAYDVKALENDTYVWPGKGETKQFVGVTVTVRDAMDNVVTKSAKVILKDTTQVAKVTYTDGVTDEVIFEDKVFTENVEVGGKTPEFGEAPVREYYDFIDWNPAVEKTITKKDTTYQAQWKIKAECDTNTNGIPDAKETFKVEFVFEDADGKQVVWDTAKNVAWGTNANALKPAKDPTKAGYVFKKWTMPTSPITADLQIPAEWEEVDENTYLVTYVIHKLQNGTVSVTERILTMNEDGKAKEIPAPDGEGIFWSGWYADDAFATKYDFTKKLSGDLTLYSWVAEDADKNGKADGTTEDPYVIYYHMMWEKGTPGNYPINTETVYASNMSAEVAEQELLKMSYAKENYEDNKVFDHWMLDEESTTGTEYCQSKYFYPVFTEENNHNGVADKEEMTHVATVWPYETAAPSYMGAVSVDGVAVNPASPMFIRNSKKVDGTELTKVQVALNPGVTVVTGITLMPAAQTMMLAADDLLEPAPALKDGELPLPITYENYTTVSATIPAKGDSWTMDDKTYTMGEGTYVLTVYFADAKQFTVKENIELYVSDLFNDDEKVDVAKLYEAVVNTPVYHADATIAVNYVARPAKTYKIPCQELAEQINNLVNIAGLAPSVIWNRIQEFVPIEKDGNNYYYVYEQSEEPLSVEAMPLTATVTDPEELINNYLAKLKAKVSISGASELVNVVCEGHDELVANLAKANIHPFGYNAKPTEQTDSLKETLYITYNDGRQNLSSDAIEVTVLDNRSYTSISVPNKLSFTYGESNLKAKLEDKVTLSGTGLTGNEVVDLIGSFENLEVGTYTATASFGGNESQKSSSLSFPFTITKATVQKLDVNSFICELKDLGTEGYTVTPTIEPAEAKTLQVVVGLEATSGKLNLEGPYVSDIKGKAWINTDKETAALMQAILEGGDYTLARIENTLKDKREKLIEKLNEETVDDLIKALQKIQKFVDAEVEVIFGEPEITTEGVYVNYITAVDDNYNAAEDYAAFVIAPMIPGRNNGGIQLVVDGKDEDVFVISAEEAKNKALRVTLDGKLLDADHPIYYYGVASNGGELHSGYEMPTEAGIYAVATVYYDEVDGTTKLGSDAAVLMIDMIEATIEVAGLSTVANGDKYGPTVTITKKAGGSINADVTMISGKLETANAKSLSDLVGDVYVDLPEWVGRNWAKFSENKTVTKATLLAYIEDCKAYYQIPVNKLAEMNISNDKLNKATQYVGKNLEKLEEYVNQIPDDKVTIHVRSTKDYPKYDQPGIYLYCGIITDASVVPHADVGRLILKGDDSELYMEDTKVPYDGDPKEPTTVDNTGRQGLTMIVDHGNKLVKLLVDDNMKDAIVNKVEPNLRGTLAGKKLLNKTYKVIDIAEAFNDFAEDVAKYVVERAKEEAVKISGGRFNSVDETVTNLLDTMGEELQSGLKAQLLALQLPDYNDYSITVVEDQKKELPTEIGTYRFHNFSYAMIHASATLEIVMPVTLTVEDAEMNLGGDLPAFTYTAVDKDGKTVTIDTADVTFEILNAANEKVTEITEAGEYTIHAIVDEEKYPDYAITVVDGKLTVKVADAISLYQATLEFESIVHLNIYSTITGFENVDLTKSMGLLVWTGDEDLYNEDQFVVGNEYITDYPGAEKNGPYYKVSTDGIVAKKLGDEHWMRVYVENPDGSYTYSKAIYYGPQTYALGRLKNSKDENMKKLMMAMLDYAAAAQVHFTYPSNGPANDIDQEYLDKYRMEFSESILRDVNTAADSVVGDWTRDKNNCPYVIGSLVMEGIITNNFSFKFTPEIMSKVASAKFLFWDAQTYQTLLKNGQQFAESNATEVKDMKLDPEDGYYKAGYDKTAVKNLGDSIYVCGVVTTTDGQTYRSGVISYSGHRYIQNMLTHQNANFVKLVKCLGVYSDTAKTYFVNRK